MRERNREREGETEKSGKETMRGSKNRREKVNQISGTMCQEKCQYMTLALTEEQERRKDTGEKTDLALPWEGHKKYETWFPTPVLSNVWGPVSLWCRALTDI